jgi:hypothetical protein
VEKRQSLEQKESLERKELGDQALPLVSCTDKKENQIFLIYNEIKRNGVQSHVLTASSYMYGEKFAHNLIY